MAMTLTASLDLIGVTHADLCEFLDYVPDNADLSTGIEVSGTGEFFDEHNMPKMSLTAKWTTDEEKS